ncbi:hypothetical protein BCV70DRAFT_113631 [Testicularia cyperi]|uniref:Uncharacterized protein n=1 Tax=Testicularia cyperi TaxID=1882483 RepID=A0A317XP20_9BASI|nr:hypothetical protein BCV70DRAFT_113631 [Testicularia cyperi]
MPIVVRPLQLVIAFNYSTLLLPLPRSCCSTGIFSLHLADPPTGSIPISHTRSTPHPLLTIVHHKDQTNSCSHPSSPSTTFTRRHQRNILRALLTFAPRRGWKILLQVSAAIRSFGKRYRCIALRCVALVCGSMGSLATRSKEAQAGIHTYTCSHLVVNADVCFLSSFRSFHTSIQPALYFPYLFTTPSLLTLIPPCCSSLPTLHLTVALTSWTRTYTTHLAPPAISHAYIHTR